MYVVYGFVVVSDPAVLGRSDIYTSAPSYSFSENENILDIFVGMNDRRQAAEESFERRRHTGV